MPTAGHTCSDVGKQTVTTHQDYNRPCIPIPPLFHSWYPPTTSQASFWNDISLNSKNQNWEFLHNRKWHWHMDVLTSRWNGRKNCEQRQSDNKQEHLCQHLGYTKQAPHPKSYTLDCHIFNSKLKDCPKEWTDQVRDKMLFLMETEILIPISTWSYLRLLFVYLFPLIEHHGLLQEFLCNSDLPLSNMHINAFSWPPLSTS